ncbi:hypothetical protein [Pedobacter montanisoli]|uniref:Uncharacterized protein n=1 Tax=Pedobacter montanisoli TaxID=2923277 RepID=A0ABS9ZV86_9SPHI|nr:hypothetical protein [Pedobacter montanisoli]MCJ0742164.1 hypothetical protein [Pedobacter montanisoli]
MKITTINISLFLIGLFGSIPFIAKSQKLPQIQQTGKLAPADIKIDGKTTEWNDEFQAHNLNNRIYYTISNDDSNLYLTVRTSDGYGNEKAIFGISFTVKLPSEKGGKSKENVMVTFPPLSEVRKTTPIRLTMTTIRQQKADTTNSGKKKMDSLRLFANKYINETFKEINVTGIKNIPERSISIYNAEGIKVAAQLNEHFQYTYELAIPLKYLGPSINNGQKFSYNIKMNGLPEKAPDSPYAPPTISGNVLTTVGADNLYVTYATDFSGTYTLVKKGG